MNMRLRSGKIQRRRFGPGEVQVVRRFGHTKDCQKKIEERKSYQEKKR